VSTPVMGTLPAAAVGGSVKSRDDGDGASPAEAVLPGVGRPSDTPVQSAAVESTPTQASPADVPIREGATASAEVVVVPGDCLWKIAARAIGPDATDAEIAAAWPRWYARNRATIGADPDFLIPGTVLRPPA
jgi:resuscitation-promoting factor RpfA